MPANILNLPQYRVLRVEESDHDYHVTAEPVGVTSACPHCQSDRLTCLNRHRRGIVLATVASYCALPQSACESSRD